LAFDNLRERLLLGGVAPRHVRRYLRELDEHLDDLTAQQRQGGYDGEDAAIRARARLGGDDELASAMLAQKRFRSWTARAPWAVFLFLPPIAALAFGMLVVGSVALVENISASCHLASIRRPYGSRHWRRILWRLAI
jgi:hypothetical protein